MSVAVQPQTASMHINQTSGSLPSTGDITDDTTPPAPVFPPSDSKDAPEDSDSPPTSSSEVVMEVQPV